MAVEQAWRRGMLLALVLVLAPACANAIHPFRFNFNFGRRAASPAATAATAAADAASHAAPAQEITSATENATAPADVAGSSTPADSSAPGLTMQGAEAAAVAPTPVADGGGEPAGGMQRIEFPIQIPATGNTPAHTMSITVMAPPGVRVQHAGVVPGQLGQLMSGASVQHIQIPLPGDGRRRGLIMQQVQIPMQSPARELNHNGHLHSPSPQQDGMEHEASAMHEHQHDAGHQHAADLAHLNDGLAAGQPAAGHAHAAPHHHAPGCRHRAWSPGQMAVRRMLEMASEQCNLLNLGAPGPFHWPDRVMVCAHEPDEAGNNLQVLLMHGRQRAVFEINIPLQELRAVVPPMLLHVHDTLFTGMVRKTLDSVLEALSVCPWPSRPPIDTARSAGDPLDGKWTVEWLQGSTIMHGASTIVNGSRFRVMDSDYILQSSGDTDLVGFTWSDGTVQTLVHDNGTSLTWNTSSSQLPHIVWRRGWGHAGCNSGRAGGEDGQDAGPETEECAVCCEALGDMCAWLPCGHVFHETCIKKWLSEASTCPTCRHSLPSQVTVRNDGVSGDLGGLFAASQSLAGHAGQVDLSAVASAIESFARGAGFAAGDNVEDAGPQGHPGENVPASGATGSARDIEVEGNGASAAEAERQEQDLAMASQDAGQGVSREAEQRSALQEALQLLASRVQASLRSPQNGATQGAGDAAGQQGSENSLQSERSGGAVAASSAVPASPGTGEQAHDEAHIHQFVEIQRLGAQTAWACTMCNTTGDDVPDCRFHGAKYACSMPGCATVLCRGCWEIMRSTCTYHWHTHQLLHPPLHPLHPAAREGHQEQLPDASLSHAPTAGPHEPVQEECDDALAARADVDSAANASALAVAPEGREDTMPCPHSPDLGAEMDGSDRRDCQHEAHGPAQKVVFQPATPEAATGTRSDVPVGAQMVEGRGAIQRDEQEEEDADEEDEEQEKRSQLMHCLASFLREESARLVRSKKTSISAADEAVSIASTILDRHFASARPTARTGHHGLGGSRAVGLSLRDMARLSERAMASAIRSKERGNAAFHAADFQSAIKWYEQAVEACPVGDIGVTCMGNLAAAHSKVNEWENVLRVCARALEVCPHSVKPLLLRGRALMNRWRVAEAVESYRAALTAQEAALDQGVNRLSQVEADVAPNAPAVPVVGVDNAAPRPAAGAEMDKQKRIAAVMRNVSLTPPEKQRIIQGIRTEGAGAQALHLLDATGAAGGQESVESPGAQSPKAAEEDACLMQQRKLVDSLRSEVAVVKGHLARASKISSLLGASGDGGEQGERINVAYNAHYQNSHVFYLAGQSRLSLNFSLAFLPPVGLSLQVRHLVTSNSEAAAAERAAASGQARPDHMPLVDKAILDVTINGCAIKQQYEPPSHGGYVSEQWQVPARALRKGPNVLVWDYLQGSTTHYWLQSIRLFSDAPPIFPHPPTLEPRTTDREEGV